MDEAHIEETIATGIPRCWRDGDGVFACTSSTNWDASCVDGTTRLINPAR